MNSCNFKYCQRYSKDIVQSLSHVQPCDPKDHNTPGFPLAQSLLKLTSVESVMPCNHLILCHPLLLPPSMFPSIRVFSNEPVFPIRWPKYQSFSFSISPSNRYSGLICFRMDWLDLLAVQGTLKSLLQHHFKCNIRSQNSIILWFVHTVAT